ncbi:ATP-dependent Clp protease proteolytic subunit [Halotalea alkalilenta]|uniref:ATP-dependent Clp protease proteolytic subunit n=1 Tax=Halotalea alkalilenta TaxID=376489 RepID=A0A172YCC1_9GAMM|nr:ATP-dependent Clp protease proteolytic subunit [Halotalea alkalilenta]ANF56883.1 ATP-dependent Clp protease proteolytic subunit [Halotalea alkalilenta]
MNAAAEEKDKETSTSAKLLEFMINARKVFITGEIDQKLARETVQQLHALDYLSHEPIQVFISSPGGHVESGDMIFDAIRFIESPVLTIGSGWVASAGALIFVAAKKENRYSLPNTRFLLHQPSGGFSGQSSDIAIYSKEILRMRERLNQIFAEATGQPIERIRQDTDRDFWLSASEAVDYGLVSKVVSSARELH